MRVSLIFLLFLTSCSLKAPSQVEQAELASRGAFPSGTPVWVTRKSTDSPARSGSFGLIPKYMGAPSSSGATSFAQDQVTSAHEKQIKLENEQKKNKEPVKDTRSPLEKIEDICPELEGEVLSALTTTVRSERIEKYRKLISRCDRSPDLWIWLGRDYQSDGNFDAATRSYERVLTIDRENDEARKLLESLREPSS